MLKIKGDLNVLRLDLRLLALGVVEVEPEMIEEKQGEKEEEREGVKVGELVQDGHAASWKVEKV